MLKRENIKGKYYLVGRTDTGKIIDKVRWSQTTTNDHHKLFSSQNSFNKNIEKHILYKDGKQSTIETIDYSKKARHSKRGVSMNVVSITVDGKTITARAQNKNNALSVRSSKSDALDNVYARLSEAHGGEYDADEGRRIFARLSKRNQMTVQTGIVKYANA